MFERFTDRARHALVIAQEEARGLGHNFLGTEHLLLGMLVEAQGVAGRVLLEEGLTADGVREAIAMTIGRSTSPVVDEATALATIGIDLDQVTAAVEEAFGEGALDRERSLGRRRSRRLQGGPPFVPRAKKSLELALREAIALGHSYIGTEHLLLGVLRLGEGVAYELLAERTDVTQLRPKVVEELSRLRPGA
ncbi:MAG TPA: Clp protease N-terminal domain-containing protein [Acidimicrobiales bacterium]|nr:Clp protease N-terminal domain-containing protein [Acidimicrobiales bacterium]